MRVVPGDAGGTLRGAFILELFINPCSAGPHSFPMPHLGEQCAGDGLYI